MSKDSQINVRFTADLDADLSHTAAQLGVSKSALVRRLTEVFLAEVKKTGAVSLNSEWVKDLTQADARSQWGEAKMPKKQEADAATKQAAQNELEDVKGELRDKGREMRKLNKQFLERHDPKKAQNPLLLKVAEDSGAYDTNKFEK